MIKAEQIHCGQYRPYGDYFRIWSIETDEPKEDVLEYCFTELLKRRVPEKKEWSAKRDDLAYYFRGYHQLTKTETGYTFTVCEPWTD